jgi:hypothetical protein
LKQLHEYTLSQYSEPNEYLNTPHPHNSWYIYNGKIVDTGAKSLPLIHMHMNSNLILIVKTLNVSFVYNVFAYDFCQQLSISCSLNQSADRVIDVTVKWHTFLITVFVLICSFKNTNVFFTIVGCLRFLDLDLSSVFDYLSYTDIPSLFFFSSVYIRRRPHHNHQWNNTQCERNTKSWTL